MKSRKVYYQEYYKRNKEAQQKRNKDYYLRTRDDGFFSVYYLPNEHYVGMTNQMVRRVTAHKNLGKDVEGWRVLRTFKNAFDAHIYETQWHSMGANGFVGKYKTFQY